MAQWLVLDNFEGIFTDHITYRWRSGQVVEDSILPAGIIAAFETDGLAAVPYTASMATAVAAFLEQHGDDETRPSIAPTLQAAGLGQASILHGAGAPGATVGLYGQLYRDTTNSIWYVCSSDPSGATWIAMGDRTWTSQQITDAVISGVGWRETILDPVQGIAGAAGGIAPAILISITGQPTATDTLVITDGVAPETYTFVAAAAVPFDVTIGGTLAATMANLAATILADSLLVASAVVQGLDNFFAATPATQMVICNLLAVDTAAETLRLFATLTGAGAAQVVEFVTAGIDSYDADAATEAAIPVADPAAATFGFGRAFADLVLGETHNALAVDAGYSWDGDAQVWNRTIAVGPTLLELASVVPAAEGALLIGTDAKNQLGAAATVEAALEFLDDGQYDPGSVAVAQIIQAGQPVATELLTVGADVYEADGVGGNINFVIAGTAAGTLANLLAAAVANGTENLFWDSPAATHLRLRSADAPQGTVIGADPNIALTEAMTNYIFDCGNVNMNTLAGRVAGQRRIVAAVLAINAGHIAAGEVRIAFDAPVVEFIPICMTAAGALLAAPTDTFAIDNGDILVTLNGAGGDLAATDVVRIVAAV